MNFTRPIMLSVFLAALLPACGSDDNGGGSSKLESCKQVCAKSSTASCPISLPVDVCNQLCDAYTHASAACQDAVKAASDCQLKQADVCSGTGCEAQEQASQTACQ